MKTYTGKNLEELLNEVAQEKNTTVEELVYFVTEEKAGFLGIGSSVSAQVYAPSDVVRFANNYLINFFSGLDLDVEVDVDLHNNSIRIYLNSDNNAIIIGRGGNSLAGLNTLVKFAINAKYKRRFYVLIDVNNYKNDRYQKLKAIAKRTAKTVQRTKISVSLDPMPNDERRIIHQELTEFANIKTQSEGSGRNRHLKIMYVENQE